MISGDDKRCFQTQKATSRNWTYTYGRSDKVRWGGGPEPPLHLSESVRNSKKKNELGDSSVSDNFNLDFGLSAQGRRRECFHFCQKHCLVIGQSGLEEEEEGGRRRGGRRRGGNITYELTRGTGRILLFWEIVYNFDWLG